MGGFAMNTPTALFAGFAMIAATIFLTNAGPATSQGSIWGGNAWQVMNAGENATWKLNSATGDLFYCFWGVRGGVTAECFKIRQVSTSP
jgi:hypothetical protein